MKTYDVTVRRTEYREHTFCVEAKDVNDAWNKGLEEACDYNFLNARVAEAREAVIFLEEVTT